MTTRTPEQLANHFWSTFGPLLFGADRAPETEAEWIAAGKQLRALTQLDALAQRLEQATADHPFCDTPMHGRNSTGSASTQSGQVYHKKGDQRHDLAGSVYYNDAGEACCPQHERPLKEGRWGYYCSAKDERGKNGYCTFKIKEV